MEDFDNNEPYYTITEYNNMKRELEDKIEELENKIEELEGELENEKVFR